MKKTAVISCIVLMLGSASGSLANTLSGFVMLSVEQLMEIEVTSAGRKTQKLEDTAAAIYVITAEDIRPGHTEFGSITGNIEIPRIIYGAATYRF